MESNQKTYRVEGMTCAGCVASVEKALLGVQGVKTAVVNLPLENVRMEYDSDLAFGELKMALQSAGYTLVEDSTEKLSERKEGEIQLWQKRLTRVGLLGIPLLVFAMWEMMAGSSITNESILIQFFLVTPIIFISRQFYSNGMTALIHGNPNMNSLVALGTGAAYGYSLITSVNLIEGLDINGFDKLYFESAGVILVFITLGRYLEARAKNQTTKALLELFQNAPRTGWVKRDADWVEIPVGEINAGDEVMVKPGGQIPVDGVVIEGNSFVDESTITGEPIPVEKALGNKLTGATINTSGVLIMEARQVGEDTVFARIIKMVQDAQNSKAPIQSLVDKVAAGFVPVVLVLALLSFGYWLWIGEPITFAMNILISVLIIACPCALGLATPTAIVVGSGIAAKIGIHFKSAEALQTMSEIKAVIFDKTGTLTIGKPRVVNFETKIAEEEFIKFLVSIETGSEHPLSEAIINLGKTQNIKCEPCTNLEAIAGKGIQGEVMNKLVQAGSLNWMTDNNIDIPSEFEEKLNEWEGNGYTVVQCAVDSDWAGMVAISDTLRKESKSLIQQLVQAGLSLHLLTGDRQTPARYFAKELGISNVVSELLPQHKAEKVKKIQEVDGKSAMVGDGINDAPALAIADIGIAIGSGTDVAMETSDVVLLREDLNTVYHAWRLSKRVVSKIKQNLFWAFAYNVVGIPVAMGIVYPFTGYLLNPMLAGAAMALSSVSVVGNTLLLKRDK